MRINPGMKLKEPTYQVVLDSLALTTCYHAFLITAEVPVIYMHQFWATGQEFDEPPTEELRKSKKKSDLAISSEESPSKKKSAKAKKVVATKPKPTKKKAPVKVDKGKGDGTNFESRVPDEQHRKTSGIDEGTGSLGLKSYVEDDTASTNPAWCQLDDLIKMWTLSSLCDSHQEQVVTTPGNAKALWDHLKDLFHDNKDNRAINALIQLHCWPNCLLHRPSSLLIPATPPGTSAGPTSPVLAAAVRSSAGYSQTTSITGN
nr:hybrid signal transduction histidine kinase M [Tanacetum cinerariifolium]